MEQKTTPSNSQIICEACNIYLHPNALPSHISGKKHRLKQDLFDKAHKTIFISGASNFSPEGLKKIFGKFGGITKIVKQKNAAYAFIQYTDESSVQKALKARVFAGNIRLFARKYEEKNQHTPNGSQTDLSVDKGVEELPIDFPEPNQCPNGENFFDWQVQQCISQVELSQDMYSKLNDVVYDVQELFNPSFPHCLVMVFGSCGSGIAFKNSDVDLFLKCEGDQPENFVRNEAKMMYRSRLFKVTSRIPSARVPIIRFDHIKTGWHCDLTASSMLGVCNSSMIRFLISLDPRIRPVVMVIKYWAKVCGVTGTHQKLTTYALVTLIVFYLQQTSPPLLPSVATLQRLVPSDRKQYAMGWECSFCTNEWMLAPEMPSEKNNSSLKDLLVNFFKFYNEFDFNSVICPLLGVALPVSDFKNPEQLPNVMNAFKEMVKEDPKLEFRTNVMLKVQDPFELCLNITRNVTDASFVIFKNACAISCELSESNSEEDLLKSFFSVDRESLDVSNEYLKLHIPCKKSSAEGSLSEEDMIKWYKTSMEALMLVFKEVLKFQVEPYNEETSSKVKKVDSTDDVHSSSQTLNNTKDLVYNAVPEANIWESRRKMSKILNSWGVSLSPFEKEVCISNALCKPTVSENVINVILIITSYDGFKNNPTGIDIVVKDYKSTGSFKSMVNFMKHNLKYFYMLAIEFIGKIKPSSSISEVKESLQELCDSKIANLPGIKNVICIETEKECSQPSTSKSKKRVLNHEDNAFSGTSNSSLKHKQPECHSDHNKSWTSSSQSAADGGMINVPPESVASSSYQKTDDVLLKPLSVNQINTFEEDNNKGKPLHEMLKTVDGCETKSTGEITNPFLASIEKVALKSVVCDKESEEDKSDTSQKPINNSVATTLNSAGGVGDSSSQTGKIQNVPERNPTEKIVSQRPNKFSTEQPPVKFKKPFGHKTNDHNTNRSPYNKSTMFRSSPTEYQYYDEYISNRTLKTTDKYQKQLSMSREQHKKWFPSLFENK